MITLVLIGFPLLLALVLFTLSDRKPVRWIALLGAVAEFGWALFAWINYLYYCRCSLRFEAYWLNWLGISGKFGMNDFSMALTLVITFLIPLILLFTWKIRMKRPSLCFGLLFLLEILVILVATAVTG